MTKYIMPMFQKILNSSNIILAPKKKISQNKEIIHHSDTLTDTDSKHPEPRELLSSN